MAKQNIPQPAGNGQQSHRRLEIPTSERLTPRAALHLAGRALEYLLTGQPHPATFEPDDVEQAILLLSQMAHTIQPVLTGAMHQSSGGEEGL
ncbi:MAG: hypothetical protein BroJett011_62970 [Chloroflexota bacterium]|nr:MAG: hypothetical protein BroJett011_62970 [Chloroflexota bacterium]